MALPTIVGLMFASYSILLTFLFSDRLSLIKKQEAKECLICKLNSNFSISVISSISSFALVSIARIIYNLKIESDYYYIINPISSAVMTYLLTFTLKCLYNVSIDMFNIGQTASKNPRNDTESKNEENITNVSSN